MATVTSRSPIAVKLAPPRVSVMTTVHSSASASAALAKFDIKNSTAIQVGDLYMFSGMTAIDLSTFEVSDGDLATQARMTLENFGLILGDFGLSLDHVVKVNAQLTNIDDFPVWNEVFLDVFDSPYPCRTTVGAPLVVGDIEVEITAASTPRR
ncbi:MAG: reactive intermediate/imine deaminase [Acidimicrobiaceae bacterium]|nr:reactive intermediate/imine deaminase [Acidimicrobiaceae bacterium]